MKKPTVNQAARVVNSLFLDSEYQGKDWEAVRLQLIEDIERLLAKERIEELELAKPHAERIYPECDDILDHIEHRTYKLWNHIHSLKGARR